MGRRLADGIFCLTVVDAIAMIFILHLSAHYADPVTNPDEWPPDWYYRESLFQLCLSKILAHGARRQNFRRWTKRPRRTFGR